MNPKGKITATVIIGVGIILILSAALTLASLNNPIPDQNLPVNSSVELNRFSYGESKIRNSLNFGLNLS